jgi:hypothetical protein
MTEIENLNKFEIMDGAPVKGDPPRWENDFRPSAGWKYAESKD